MRNKLLIALCVIVFAAGAFFLWLRSFPNSTVMVTILPGASARMVAAELRKAGVILSEGFFVRLIRVTGASRKLKAGSYALSPRMSSPEILRALVEGKTRYVRVTIPEGFTSRQIASLMESQNAIADAKAFIAAVDKARAEGYLFPETYFFEANTGVEKAIARLQGEFRRRFTPEFQARAKTIGMSERDVVTLASIIEQEAVKAEEQPLVSAVFHNRLKKRWFLESCATVQFAIGKHKEKLSLKDTQVRHPYNTYRNYGLPPGPICNPGAGALKAALYPAETDAMFFVASSSGTHVFSRYFSDHLKNKSRRKRRP